MGEAWGRGVEDRVGKRQGRGGEDEDGWGRVGTCMNLTMRIEEIDVNYHAFYTKNAANKKTK